MLRRSFLAALAAVFTGPRLSAALPWWARPASHRLPPRGSAILRSQVAELEPIRQAGATAPYSLVVVKDEGVYAFTADGPLRLGRSLGDASADESGRAYREVAPDA